MVGHGHGFLKTFGFVINAAGADGVDVPPIFFRLGVDTRIAIDLRGRGDEDAGAFGFGETQTVVGPERAYFKGLNGDLQIVDRAGGGSEVEDESYVAGNVDKFAYVVVVEFKMLQPEKVLDIPEVTGDEVVHSDNVKSFADETIAEMGPQESCCTGDQYALFGHDIEG
jgi:hypothetical protein